MPEMEPTEEQLRFEEAMVKANVERDKEEKQIIDKRHEYVGKVRKED